MIEMLMLITIQDVTPIPQLEALYKE